MKKLLFTFFGLILCSATCLWGAETGVLTASLETSTLTNWTDGSTHATLQVGQVQFVCANKDGEANGKWIKSGSQWRVYYAYSQGPMMVQAKSGYMVKDVTLTYGSSKNAILTDVNSTEKQTANPAYASGTKISIEGTKQFYVGRSDDNTSGNFLYYTNFAVTYYRLPSSISLTSTTLSVNEKKTMVATVLPAEAYQKVTWSTSNNNVVAINETTGAMEAKAIGSAIITATDVSGTITGKCMVAVLDGGQSINSKDFYSKITEASTTSTVSNANITDENGILWQYRRYRKCDATKFGDEQGVELSSGTIGYLAYVNAQEGGVKSIAFQWRTVNADNKPLFMVDASGSSFSCDLIDLTKDASFANNQYYSKELNYTSNVYLRVRNTDKTDNSGANSGVVFGPIIITPYLFFTNKAPSVNCNSAQSFDLKTILIDNTSDPKPTFAVTSNTTGGTATIKDGVIDLKDVLSDGDIAITASWGNVSTTTTLSITALPAPTTISLNGGNALVVSTGNRFQISSSLTPSGANPNLTWSVEPSGVVEVDQNGVINVVGPGIATVTATSKANQNIKGNCTINAAVNNYTSVIDTIKAAVTTDDNYHGTTSPDEYAGDNGIFRWVMRGYRRNVNKGDKMGDGAPATRLSYNNASGHVGKNYIAYDTPYEGGVKRVSFQWKAANSVNPVSFNVDNNGQPDGDWMKYETYLPASSANTSWNTYTRDVNMDKNVQFRITIPKSEGVVLTISPLTITPYLLYTTKSVTLTKQDVIDGSYTYTNNGIINNTGDNVAENFSYSISGENNEKIAKIKDVHTGEVTILGKGTVTVTATWGEVSTSYQLTISEKLDPVITLADPDPVDVFGSYTPAPVVKIGDETISCAVAYSSGNDKVAIVESDKINLTGVGETTVTATVASSDFYNKATKPVTLNVTKPAATVAWNESFTNSDLESTGDNYNQATNSHPFNGKNNVLKWQVRNYQFNKANANKVNGEDGIRIKKDGNSNNYIATNSPNEGGVKAVYFNWRMPMGDSETSKEANFTVSVGPTTPIYSKAITSTANKGEYYPFVEEINCKSNQTFKISINANEKATIFGPITIKPYLLYTNKSVSLSASDCSTKGYKYKNTDLIDNTDDYKITYAISGDNNDKIAILNTSTGELNLIGKGKVTITAKWNDNKVTTSYTLEITEALTPTVELATPEPIELDGSYTPQPVAKFGDYVLENTAFTYTSSNANVASVSQDGKTITIQGPGITTIRAILTASAYYNTAYTDVTLTVNDYTPEDGKFFEEKFTNVPATTAYTYNKEKFEGDMKFVDDACIYKWEVYNYHAGWSGTKIALRNRENDKLGYLKMDGNFEGGIKFIAFDWKSSSQGGDVNYSVKVNEKSVPIRVPSSTADMYRFAHFFDEISNEVNLNIQMDTKSGELAYLALCPVTIMPYLLYTRKALAPTAQSLADNDFKYENTDIINNTGAELSSAAITFAIVDESADTKKIATIDANTGVVTCHGAGKVTVKATWKPDPNKADVVTTTYLLTVPQLPITVTYSDASINVTQNIPLPVATLGDEILEDVKFTYSTSKATVIEIKDGKPALVATGKANITATLNDDRYSTSEAKTAEITVTAPPAEKCFVETFDKLENKGTSYTTSEDTFNGKDDVYKWKVVEYRNSDAFGIRIRRDATNHKEGYISMNGNQEGGIKYVTFKWQSTSENLGHIVITVNETEYDYQYSSTKINKDYTWERAFNAPAKDNKFSITVKENSQIFVMVQRAVTIVPYLLYTKKTHTMNIGDTYTNENLIDNRDNAVKIQYSVKEGATYASVDEETGEVTGLKAGTATIQAKWGDVITTYQITINDKAVLSEMDNDATKITKLYNTTNNVQLIRTLYADRYNTFCVPFAVEQDELATYFGAGCKLYAMDDANTDDGITINFNEVTSGGIVAGTPYLIEVPANKENPTFPNRTISAITASSVTTDEKVTFQGVYCQTLLHREGTPMEYFLASNNYLYRPVADENMKGLRAYFKIDTDPAAPIRMQVNKPDTPTELNRFTDSPVDRFTKLIKDNQLIILRDGKTYNAQGQLMK